MTVRYVVHGMERGKLKLIYVKPIGKNSDGQNEYDLFLASEIDSTWGEFWNEQCPSACGDISPKEDMYEKIVRIKTDMELMCAQENSCFSMQDCIDGIIALCFMRIDNLDEYPDIRPVFKFGEDYNTVKETLESCSVEFVDEE